MCSCPSRTDEPGEGDGYNQNPPHLSGDLTTNQDLNGVANSREQRDAGGGPQSAGLMAGVHGDGDIPLHDGPPGGGGGGGAAGKLAGDTHVTGRLAEKGEGARVAAAAVVVVGDNPGSAPSDGGDARDAQIGRMQRIQSSLVNYAKFVGPGFMIAVAYIDPGNYATDIAAGATYRFRLLFIVLLSNLFAILLQSLAIKLGTVTGLDLSSACRVFLPRWLNYAIYALAEIAIIATDIAEVIGTAIALNLLIPQLPLIAGCALSVLDVMVILFFYDPSGSMRGVRLFEVFVSILVLGVVICFCIQLSLIENTTVGDIFRGYLPSGAIVEQQGLYQSCGILGATVMPHSLFLGSGIVQARLKDFDGKKSLLPEEPVSTSSSLTEGTNKVYYVPSLAAIKYSMKYAILELGLSLFTFALFVNSAILIVAGASLYGNPEALDADIFAIHRLLSNSISPAAGTVFALALLLSGISAGIVCTIAGQMVCEGALNWKMKPWIRRLVTRLISITPSIIIAAAVGKPGLNAALAGSQVVLSSVLPFITAPLIYFTCMNRYMTVEPGMARFHIEVDEGGLFTRRPPIAGREGGIKMANSWWVSIIALIVWLIIVVMNVANLVLLGLGEA